MRLQKPLRVLLLEDSESDAELVLRELDKGGFVVASERVQAGDAMLAALAKPWDVIVSDYQMPGFSAPVALELLAHEGVEIPFIIVSGTIDEEAAVTALRAGACDFILKSRLTRLVPAIERELRENLVRDARRSAERALRESEQRYRTIIEASNEGIWTTDSSGVVTFMNRRMAAMIGCSPEDAIGRRTLDWVDGESKEAAKAAFSAPLASQQSEIKLKRTDGAALWVLLDTAPLSAESASEGTLAMAMDVTQRKRLEDQLRQAQKMEAIGSLAGGVAHDFNNLLSVILGYTSVILDDLRSGDPIRADIEEVKKAGERAADLTRQLLAFGRQQMLQPRILDLNQVVVGVEKMLRRIVGEDIELSFLSTPRLGQVSADRGQIEQVLVNLVVNARDALPGGGKLSIETEDVLLDQAYAAQHISVRPGRYVMLAVTDTGIGMDAETRARIFEPFFTTKEKGKGTGLGLSTVFGIVQQSGGHIWVYSELGKGTTFKIYLPRVDADGVIEPLPPPMPATTVRGTETILLVEDEEQVRTILRTVLRRHGYNVLEAQNGGEAFLVCEKYPAKIHMLLTDVVMPRMSGRELAERLSPMRPDMRVLYISGYTENSVVHHGILDSGIAFLQKPITPDPLLRKVREVLDR